MSDMDFAEDDDEQLVDSYDDYDNDHDDEEEEQDEDQGGAEEDNDDGDEELFGGDETVRGGALRAMKSYQVLEKEQLIMESSSLINETKEVLGLPSKAVTAVLLRHFKWNKEKLIEKYTETPEKVLEASGFSSLALEKKPKNPDKKLTCLICLDDVVEEETFALACGHRYCKSCWSTFLELRIEEGAESVYTRCMSPGCKEIVHEEAFKAIVSSDLFKKYSIFLLRSFVEDNPQIKWCPAPGCENAVRCDLKNRTEAVECKCGFRYCFLCNDYNIGDHMPATCEQVEKWLQKASDESENVTWLIANTKKCPQCRSPIEKNGGCMHMHCKRNAGGCGHEFCWLCRGPWSEHGSHTGGYYNCNKYEKSDAKSEDEKAGDVKTELEIYMFHYHRYESHKNAMKIADGQRQKATSQGEAFQQKFNVRSSDTKFLVEATEQLLKNRRVLQYSYVVGYYLTTGANKDKAQNDSERNLFLYLQEDLEKHTNHLSEILENQQITDYQKFISWKEEITNYTRVTAKFLDNFIQGVSGGLVRSS